MLTDAEGPASRNLGWIVLSLVLGAGVGVTFIGFYIVPRDDVPQDPDVVVVLGGAGQERAALGIELAERYETPLVLSSSAAVFGERQGRTCGVDALCFEPDPPNTAGEAATIRELAQREGWQHVTVATSAFHTSRSRFLFRQCLGAARVSVVGAAGSRGRENDPEALAREALGVVTGATFARAC